MLLGTVAVAGVPRGLAVDGDMLYVAAGSAGLVVVDATDLRGRQANRPTNNA